jgi:methylthioribose-1-phosphate isomerase
MQNSHIYWKDGALHLLDQRKLPFTQEYMVCTNLGDVEAAIKKMVVRGAPLIGIVAAYGVVIGMAGVLKKKGSVRLKDMKKISARLLATRPTAVNLAWALKRMETLPLLLAVARLTELGIAMSEDKCSSNQVLNWENGFWEIVFSECSRIFIFMVLYSNNTGLKALF